MSLQKIQKPGVKTGLLCIRKFQFFSRELDIHSRFVIPKKN